jgi:hypothetical protein
VTLIDTSAWIEALRSDGDAAIRQEVALLLESGRAVLCDIVVLELWNGARGDSEKAKLQRIFNTLSHVPTTPEVWSTANDFARQCRGSGITVPATDLLVAATARIHGLRLLEADQHFGMIPT